LLTGLESTDTYEIECKNVGVDGLMLVSPNPVIVYWLIAVSMYVLPINTNHYSSIPAASEVTMFDIVHSVNASGPPVAAVTAQFATALAATARKI